MFDGAREALAEEVALWRAGGRVPRLWLRDDDAVHPTPALDRLLALVGAEGVPLTLAVIPRDTGAALAARVAAAPGVTVAVHGWAHVSHRRPGDAGRPNGEYGAERPAQVRLAEARAGLDRLRGLHGDRVLPVFVPPWNRIQRSFVPRLAEAGYRALSAWGEELEGGLAERNAQVALVDYAGGAHAADPARIARQLLGRLAACRVAGQGAVGVLGHHLDHGPEVEALLLALIRETRAAGCDWVGLADLLPAPGPE